MAAPNQPVVLINPPWAVSDGLTTLTCHYPNVQRANDLQWRLEIGQKVAESRGLANLSMFSKAYSLPIDLANPPLLATTNYVLSAMPWGYVLWSKQRAGGGSRGKLDYYVSGHPKGKYIRSIKQFNTHVLWLEGGKQGVCGCKPCYRKMG